MNKIDPSTGPVPRDEFASFVNAPFGQAVKTIRKYDPLYAREPNEKIKWRARFERKVREDGWATVEASTKEEAQKLANDLPEAKINWDVCCDWGDDGDLISVEPEVGS